MVEKGELTVPGIDFELDKLHEECGVFGIYSHKDDVALNTYWGLYAFSIVGRKVPVLLLLMAAICRSKKAWVW